MKNNKPTYEELLNENETLKQQLEEKKNLEKELEKAQILMQSAFNQSPVPMVVVTYPDFTFKIINKAAENFLLADAAKYLNKSPLEIEWTWQEYLPDGTKITNMGELPLPCALQGITTINKEMRIERKDGSSVWELASASPIYDSEGTLIAGILAMVDITERKGFEETLEQNKQQLHEQNAEYEVLNEKLLQANQELHNAKEKAEESKTIIQKQYNELQSTEEEIRANNEELMATTDALKESYNVLQIAKEKAEENENRFKSLFQNMNNSASHYEVIYNNKGIPIDYRFLDVNVFYVKSIGINGADLIGKTLLEVFPQTEPLWLDAFKEVVLTSNPMIMESYSKAVDMYFELIAYVPQKGKIALIGSDITERKRNEKELILAKEKAEESNQLKSAFLENISHEIRTPMNSIMGFSNLLLNTDITDEKRQQFTDLLQKATHQLLTVVDHTITLSQIETNQLQINKIDFSPTVLLANLLSDYNSKKQLIGKSHIGLLVKPQSTSMQIRSDYTRINEIFNILLDNAFKFTDNGTIEIGYTLGLNKINFFVKDTGIGIPPEKQQIIFKSFTQADKNIRQLFGGLGVGLSIAMGLVSKLNGEIVINSEINTGTVVIFSLPMADEINNP